VVAMINKAIILIFIIGLCQPLLAGDINRCCFSKAIYDDDGRPDDSYEEKILKLNRKKEHAIEVQMLYPLDNEIEKLKDLLIIETTKWGVQVWGLAIAAIFFPQVAYLIVIPQTFGFCHEATNLERKINLLKASKQEILRDLRDWERGSLENEYIRRRPGIRPDFRDRIESLLLDDFKTRANHKMLIEDLIFFPSRIECLSKNGDKDQFAEGLARAEAQLDCFPTAERFAATDVLASLAEASFYALMNQARSRCATYFQIDHYDRALPLFQHLAYTLNRSHFVVYATKDSLSGEYLFGTKTKRGIVLKAFMAQRNTSSLNPLLIIINIDEWMNEANLSLLLPLLDPDPPNKMVQSAYLGVAIDWSAMSVLSCGTKSDKDFPAAIRSRIHSYKID